jgi:hypothetical protein
MQGNRDYWTLSRKGSVKIGDKLYHVDQELQKGIIINQIRITNDHDVLICDFEGNTLIQFHGLPYTLYFYPIE